MNDRQRDGKPSLVSVTSTSLPAQKRDGGTNVGGWNSGASLSELLWLWSNTGDELTQHLNISLHNPPQLPTLGHMTCTWARRRIGVDGQLEALPFVLIDDASTIDNLVRGDDEQQFVESVLGTSTHDTPGASATTPPCRCCIDDEPTMPRGHRRRATIPRGIDNDPTAPQVHRQRPHYAAGASTTSYDAAGALTTTPQHPRCIDNDPTMPWGHRRRATMPRGH
ncbi:hypothetical protein BDZ97DRAFT_1912929 [Flammula alnicola]|nr:hypothetical protein BDZ97DRAFT_1912929 [Flammula alnicola]